MAQNPRTPKSRHHAGKPPDLQQVDDLAKHVYNTMLKRSPRLGRSLLDLLRGLLKHGLRWHLVGQTMHPGIAKMAGMGRCSERRAIRNLAVLKGWQVIEAIAYEGGGRHATRYVINLMMLKRALIHLQCNPSPQLLTKIAAMRDRLRDDIGNPATPDFTGDTVSDGFKEDNSDTNAQAATVRRGRSCV